MSFVRTKTIKGKKYAYLVENVWTKKGPRQKAKMYLGRVYSFRREKHKDFYEYYDQYNLEVRSKKEIIKDCIKLELFNYGFKNENNLWTKDKCIVDVKKIKIFNEKSKDVAIEMNDGMLCKPLIKKVLNLKIDSSKEVPEKEGYKLAKLLVESGLKVDPTVFVKLYELSKF